MAGPFRNLGRFTLLGLALAVVRAVPAHATSLAPLTTEQMTDAATWIVEGQVTAVWTELDDATGYVWTRAQLALTDVRKGPADPSTLVVDSLGGTYGATTTTIAGQAVFSVGEDVFLFLDEVRDGRFVPIAKLDGKFTVRRAPGDTRSNVMHTQPVAGVTYDARFLPHPPPEDRVYLDDLRAQVEARLAVGWQGELIPGADRTKLEAVNTLERRHR
jgi:hypothetical protein